MVDKLPLLWYVESPIDFEHKQYTLLAYLQIVDNCFIYKNLSPHLLHMEKMIKELLRFEMSYENIKKDFDKNKYIYFQDNSKIEGENDYIIKEVFEIVEFSIPQVKTRVDLGYKILQKNCQILY